jgi:hypothetical protein
MDEVTIWCKVLEKIGWKFHDEETGPDNINKMIYWKEGQYFNLYFNLKTSEVKSINVRRTSYDQVDKPIYKREKFQEVYKDIFREIKLDIILDNLKES